MLAESFYSLQTYPLFVLYFDLRRQCETAYLGSTYNAVQASAASAALRPSALIALIVEGRLVGAPKREPSDPGLANKLWIASGQRGKFMTKEGQSRILMAACQRFTTGAAARLANLQKLGRAESTVANHGSRRDAYQQPRGLVYLCGRLRQPQAGGEGCTV